jgi:hypothetical protein
MKDLLANGIFPQPLTARKCKFSSPECALGKSFTSMVLMFRRPWPVRLSMNVSTTEHEPTMLPALAVYLFHARFGVSQSPRSPVFLMLSYDVTDSVSKVPMCVRSLNGAY